MTDNKHHDDEPSPTLNRRRMLGATAAAMGTAVGSAALAGSTAAAEQQASRKVSKKASKKVVNNGRIKQSIVQWCFNDHWNVEETCKVAKQMGVGSVELVAPEHYPTLKKYGLQCAIATIDMGNMPPFVRGMNNPKYRAQVLDATRKAIDAAADFGCRRVISFTGMAEGLSREDGAKNCVAGYKEIIGYAEKKKITLCLEMLNTRDDTHPMKGHPGYQGDDTEYCIDIIKQVGSPHLKLLFDIYHVQIMNGDVIRRIQQHKQYLGHIHTAGNPGRGELDAKQEISYKPIMEALLAIGYKGFVGQEFIPTRDPLAGLTQAVKLCDV